MVEFTTVFRKLGEKPLLGVIFSIAPPHYILNRGLV